MRIALIAAALTAAAGTAVHGQRVVDLTPFNAAKAVGDIGSGWVKKQEGEEGVTYVCETDACGGRGVVGVGQAKATPDYVKEVVTDPEKTLKSYRYATDESMRPSGCTFDTYEFQRLNERRVRYESRGACRDGTAAAMSTIFDLDRSSMISVQVLTRSPEKAVGLRDAAMAKVAAALDGAEAPASR